MAAGGVVPFWGGGVVSELIWRPSPRYLEAELRVMAEATYRVEYQTSHIH